MKKSTTNYREMDLKYLDSEDMFVIESRAKGLTLAECFDYIGADLADVPAEELIVAKRAHARGRQSGIAQAVDHLFSSMSGSKGGINSLAYLRQMSGQFSVEAVPDNSAKGFSFNVVMPEDAKE